MKLTDFQLDWVKNGLSKAQTPQEKWHIVLTVLGLGIIGCKIKQDAMNHNKTPPEPSLRKYEVREVVVTPKVCVFAFDEFWESHQYSTNWALCHVQGMTFDLNRMQPRIEGAKLILGSVPGWGPWEAYIELSATEEKTSSMLCETSSANA